MRLTLPLLLAACSTSSGSGTETTATGSTSGVESATASSTTTSASTLTPQPSTGAAPTSTTDAETPCTPDTDFCSWYEALCPLHFDAASCDAVTPECASWSSICELCDAAAQPCFDAFGTDAPTCLKGVQKCLASSLLPGCECQPAVFPCAETEAQCPEGYHFFERGGLCQPPCDSPDTCGPEYYATCVDGLCKPNVLVLCF